MEPDEPTGQQEEDERERQVLDAHYRMTGLLGSDIGAEAVVGRY